MTREAIDGISAPDGRERIARAVGWMVVFAACHGGFRYLARRGLLETARRVEMRLRRDIFSHVVRLPLAFFGKTPTGDVVSRITNDVSAVWLFLGPGLLTLIGTVVSYVLALAFMVRISVSLTVVSLALAPLVVLVSRGYGRAFHRLHRKVQETLSAMNATLQENITGIRLVKAYGLEEAEERRFGTNCADYYDQNVSVSRTSAAFHGAIGFLAGTGVALVLFLGSRLVIRGSLSLGGFVAFNAYLAMLAFPTMALGWVINLVERGGSAMGRINEFLRLPAELRIPGAEPPRDGEAGVGDARVPGDAFLAVRDLSFSYGGEGRGEALRGVSFEVGRGELVGLVGPTGSGKSTLLSLILRFHPPPPGTILLGGRDVGDLPLETLRRSIAWVGQDPFLFSDTLLANIGYGLPEPDPAPARRAAGHARILSEIEEMPEGFLTVIGERGISLSGGQKQRATLARALCGGGELLLLDDALSSIDSETEREIFDEIVAAQRATVERASPSVAPERRESQGVSYPPGSGTHSSVAPGERQSQGAPYPSGSATADQADSSVAPGVRESRGEPFRSGSGRMAARAGRTVLFSTHRMVSLSRCDRILVMDGGRIAEQGTHDELLSRRGTYFDLYSRQMLARELEDSP